MLSIRFARSFAVAGFLAAAVAALPSLEWCPLAGMASSGCELLPRARHSATAASSEEAYEATTTCESPLACAAMHSLACDREPDPLPIGDRVWCIRPPWSALVTRADDVPAPHASAPLAVLVVPKVLTPPLALRRARSGAELRPPTLSEAHAPPQPRAPPHA